VRLDIRRVGTIKSGEDAIGNRTRVKVVKNKLAPPFRSCEFDIMFGTGISRAGDALDLGVEKNFVEKSGAWFTYDGERIGQGRENARKYFETNPRALAALEKKILEMQGLVRHKPRTAEKSEEPARGKKGDEK